MINYNNFFFWALYDHVTSTVLLSNQVGDFFQITISVRQIPTLSNTLQIVCGKNCVGNFPQPQHYLPVVDMPATYIL